MQCYFPNGKRRHGLPHDVDGITAGTSAVSQTPTQTRSNNTRTIGLSLEQSHHGKEATSNCRQSDISPGDNGPEKERCRRGYGGVREG